MVFHLTHFPFWNVSPLFVKYDSKDYSKSNNTKTYNYDGSDNTFGNWFGTSGSRQRNWDGALLIQYFVFQTFVLFKSGNYIYLRVFKRSNLTTIISDDGISGVWSGFNCKFQSDLSFQIYASTHNKAWRIGTVRNENEIGFVSLSEISDYISDWWIESYSAVWNKCVWSFICENPVPFSGYFGTLYFEYIQVYNDRILGTILAIIYLISTTNGW